MEWEGLVERNDARRAAHYPIGTIVAPELRWTGQAVGTRSQSVQRVTQTIEPKQLV